MPITKAIVTLFEASIFPVRVEARGGNAAPASESGEEDEGSSIISGTGSTPTAFSVRSAPANGARADTVREPKGGSSQALPATASQPAVQWKTNPVIATFLGLFALFTCVMLWMYSKKLRTDSAKPIELCPLSGPSTCADMVTYWTRSAVASLLLDGVLFQPMKIFINSRKNIRRGKEQRKTQARSTGSGFGGADGGAFMSQLRMKHLWLLPLNTPPNSPFTLWRRCTVVMFSASLVALLNALLLVVLKDHFRHPERQQIEMYAASLC